MVLKKKTEKQKDFVKPKLKVGKSKAKAGNYTDTSFVAKRVVLPQQSVNKKAAGKQSEEEQLGRYISLFRHHSANTRKEALNYIEKHLPSNPSQYKDIISNSLPLMSDESPAVRNALMGLLSACGQKQSGLIELHLRPIVLFIHLAMTNIRTPVRNSSTKFLTLLVDTAPLPFVRLFFVRTMRSFFTLMAWSVAGDKKSVALGLSGGSNLDESMNKAKIQHLFSLRRYLQVALFPIDEETHSGGASAVSGIHPQTGKYLLASRSQPFSHLNLFYQDLGRNSRSNDLPFSFQDLDSISTDDLETRRKVMADIFRAPMMKNLRGLIKEGGEIGREANSCVNLITELFDGTT